MLDSQFSTQNGNGTPAPGISLLVAPPGTVTPEVNKWTMESPKPEGRKLQINDNMSNYDRMVICASEICGTAILVFVGCSSCINFEGTLNILQICLTFGFAIIIAVQSFGHISGCHINPIITVAAVTFGNISLIQVPIYIAGQMVGALAGFGLLKVVTPSVYIPNGSEPGICSPSLGHGVTPFQGFLVEFLTSLMLTLVCCGAWDNRNKGKDDSLAVKLGLTIAGLALVGISYTGGNMNPARSFAPALLNGDWDDHWLYWVGPLSAGFVGALFYRFVFLKDTTEEE